MHVALLFVCVASFSVHLQFGRSLLSFYFVSCSKFHRRNSCDQNRNIMSTLNEAELAQIAKNREKALSLRAKRSFRSTDQNNLVAADGSKKRYENLQSRNQTKSFTLFVCLFLRSNVPNIKLIDSGGGFLIEKEITPEENASSKALLAENVCVEDEALDLPPNYEECLDCHEPFVESWLLTNFAYSVCSKCYDSEERHALITRTEAKDKYLLKDCDFDRRTPPLKFIERPNPHNERWGTMKLYLRMFVEKRAIEVWGSEERILEELEARNEKREAAKHKKYAKNIKKLRMEMRSSLYDTRTVKGQHKHEYGAETYNEEDDNYSHTCSGCGFVETFEKM